MLSVPRGTSIVLDLDDTLYAERDYQKSGFQSILDVLGYDETTHLTKMLSVSIQGGDAFESIGLTNEQRKTAISLYRNHRPQISLYEDAKQFMTQAISAECPLYLATEGRSIAQRNKLEALGIEHLFNEILISEELGHLKTEVDFYQSILTKGVKSALFIGDNPSKDFVVPNEFGWLTVMLRDRGSNVHSQDLQIRAETQPRYTVSSFAEIQFD